MNVKKITSKPNKAQAMVEFALVLPILLLLLYGILEAGRLLFIYSTIVTASRQAVRYGSATGEGSSTVPRYQDCAGIRAAAQRVDYLNAFEDRDIVIEWDNGPGTTVNKNFCGGNPVTSLPPSDDTFGPTNNQARLLVTIDGDYLPIVPRIVGFLERSDAKNNAIKAQSARTVMVSVTIFVTAPPSNWTPSTSTATKTSTPTDTPTATNTATSTATQSGFTSTPSPSATPTASPTVTATRTPTLIPTITRTPTRTPTRVPSCTTSHGAITFPGNNTMTLTITNPNAWPLTIGDVFVIWDHDKGHQTGNDKTLILESASLGTTQFWNGSLPGPNAGLDPTAPLIIPPGTTVTMTFTFHQTYDRSDGSEEIDINLSTPGCEGSPIIVDN